MKLKLHTICLLSLLIGGCTQQKNEKIYRSRVLMANESFNDFRKANEDSLNIYQLIPSMDSSQLIGNAKEMMLVKFGDTVVKIQSGDADKGTITDKFAAAKFINTQKTCMLVQSADSSGLTAPFFLIAQKEGKLDIISLYRPSNGAEDSRFTKGLSRVGRSGYLINNDFFITMVNAKAYFIKRINEDQRIPGLHFVNSPDRKTLVFLLNSSLYQVHYPTGKVITEPIPEEAPDNPEKIYPWIQDNFSWQKNKAGISFLYRNGDANRIVNISEFK